MSPPGGTSRSPAHQMNQIPRLIRLIVTAFGMLAAMPSEAAGDVPDDITAERVWTSNRGERIRGTLVEFNFRKVALDLGDRVFWLPMGRLHHGEYNLLLELIESGPGSLFKPGEPWLEEVDAPLDASGRPVAPETRSGIALPIRMVPLPEREWTLRSRPSRIGTGSEGRLSVPPFRGRLVGARENLLLIETGGEVRAFAPVELDGRETAYVREWTQLGVLERDDPEGAAGDRLRGLGFEGWRFWHNLANTEDPDRNSLPYQLFTPTLEPGRAYPLVIVLHGRGEAGMDNVRQFLHPDPLIFVEEELQKRHPCFVMVPQHGEAWYWVSNFFRLPSLQQQLVVKAVRRMMMADYAGRIDPDRIYVVGLWSGGHGGVQMCALYPETFAACVATSSRPRIEWFEDSRFPPMWFFLHDQDSPVFLESLRAFSADMPRHMPQPIVTIHSGDRHEGRREALRDSGVIDWLFEQRLGDPSTELAVGWDG